MPKVPAWTSEPIAPEILEEYRAWRVEHGLGEDSTDATGLLAKWLAHKLAELRTP